MKFLVLAFVLFAAATVSADSDEEDQAWNDFKLEHSKLFLSKNKETGRKKTFLKNRAKVIELEAKAEAGEISYTPKLYGNADLTSEEFLSRFGGFKSDDFWSTVTRTKFANVRQNVPASFDARTKNWIGPVRNQGSCGSCWTFSAMAAIEGGLGALGYPGHDLSEQQLVDCGIPGEDGCEGGSMTGAFEYLAQAGGALRENQYPYTGVYGKCRQQQVTDGILVKGPIFPSTTKEDVKAALMKHGVLAIAVDCYPWQFYGGGIFHGDKNQGANHAVNLVGWGVEGTQEYWIIRNSWGPNFGEKGYIRVAMTRDGGYDLTNTWAVELGY